ncbi:hypothetical protein [Microbacterium sp. MMO-10]|uniref:hypothetical protein n=1 Tax=Microbacterium sp. MMO-10 TaxID=3081272 RepID=UPI003018B9A4
MSDDYQSIPVAVARAAVQESGQLEGIEGPLFLAEVGEQWEPFFSKATYGADGHPEFAKVTVTRKGQKPREVVIAWDEYAEQMDTDPEWDAIRAQKPMAVFGGEAERHAYRVVFADILASLAPVAQQISVQTFADTEPRTATVPGRDWFTEVNAASAQLLLGLFDEARKAGVIPPGSALLQAFTDRQIELSNVAKPAAPNPAKVAELAKLGASLPERSPQGSGNRRRRGKR